ncbi:MAG: DUF805 domain-containing protein [Alphaproteobacteria bacterium]
MKKNIMTLSEAVKKCFSKYITISGRVSSAEYWLFYLTLMLFILFIFLVSAIIPLLFWLAVLGYLAIIPPYISMTVRRLHDTNHSGHYLWLYVVMVFFSSYLEVSDGDSVPNVILFAIFAVFIMNLIILWWLIKKGDKGKNKFGPPQKK